jgi:hypothetical protein
MWRRVEPACRHLALGAGAEAPPTFDDFLWAYSIFWSRALAFPCPAAAAAAPGAAAAAPSGVSMQEGIVPGLDFCNHAPQSAARWTVFGGDRPAHTHARAAPPADVRLVCPCGAPLRAGQEVTISYGDKSNEELLFLYGFVEADNPHDALMLACPLPPPAEWDAPLRARVAALRARGLAPQMFLPAAALEAPGGCGGAARAGKLRFHGRQRRGELSGSVPTGPDACAAAVREEDLPEGVMRTLEVFVMELDALRAELEGEEAGGGQGSGGGEGSGGGMGPAERSGLRMAVLTTLVRLLEAKVAELESSETGTGSLAADERLLEASAEASAEGGGGGGGAQGLRVVLSPAQRAALVYRVGQKRLARGYQLYAAGLLAQEMRHLQALAE